jgi:alpha-beta hydrolase superfamily lysophospholipase
MIEERVTVGYGTRFPLFGLLTLPDGSVENVPAVVLVHGTGPNNMNEGDHINAPFRDIAEYLTGRGIAVLRYDKRTFGYMDQMDREDMTVVNEVIEDAVLAADILRNDKRIDKNRIFVAGHSLGGILAPRIDAEGGNFAGLILLAGSPQPISKIIKEGSEINVAELSPLIRKVASKEIAAQNARLDRISSMSDEEAKKTFVFGHGKKSRMRAYYIKEMEAHPAEKYLRATDKPILILQGEMDFQVRAEKDFEAYKKLLGDKENVTFILYPKLNHLFMESMTGTYKDYSKPGKVDATVLKDISDWILSK